tara:strand:+ start:238 stop:906 length:669 start_codon:yes stop_codon:yes gene_type:complete
MDIIIQARLSSKRLPKKVLLKINKKPLLKFLIERVNMSKFKNRIIIATTLNRMDNAIEKFCFNEKISCFRGSLTNVTKRYSDLIHEYNLKSFVRICADSPLIDPKIIDKAIGLFKKNNDYDLVTNKFPRSYPIGQTIEVIKAKSYLNSLSLIKTKSEKEHVTLHMYNNANRFKIKNFKNRDNMSRKILSIDNEIHFNKFKRYITRNEHTYKNHSMYEIVKKY